MFDGDVLDTCPVGGGLELLSDDWLEEGKGKRNGEALLLLPLSDIDAIMVITFEVVSLRLLSNEADVHDRSRTT